MLTGLATGVVPAWLPLLALIGASLAAWRLLPPAWWGLANAAAFTLYCLAVGIPALWYGVLAAIVITVSAGLSLRTLLTEHRRRAVGEGRGPGGELG
ncbi:hypothetical protein ACWEVD_00790 [Nocardia thailandica]